MEQLLFGLFILFSIGSALLERRKKARQQKEEKAQRQAVRDRARQQAEDDAKGVPRVQEPVYQEPEPQVARDEEEDVLEWPTPFGRDPFQEVMPESQPLDQVQLLELQTLLAERAALEAERMALRAERSAWKQERTALQATRKGMSTGRQRVAELVRDRAEREHSSQTGTAQSKGWKLDAAKAREAIVYAEILGRPRAERMDAVGGFTR